jgi:hypothetical protein
VLPGLAAIYGLKWGDIVDMPAGELAEFLDQQRTWASMHAGVDVQE